MVPEALKDAAEVNVIEVALDVIVPLSVVEAVPATTPPQVPAPQPVATVYVAKPEEIW
jgi:hypothetical protein